jgi:hypothetical protein
MLIDLSLIYYLAHCLNIVAFVLIDDHTFLLLILAFLAYAFLFVFIDHLLLHRTVAVGADWLLVLKTVVVERFIMLCTI